MNSFILRKPLVGVERVVVHGDHAEQMVIGFGDCLSGPMPINVSDFEVFKMATKWAVVGSHTSLR